MDQGKMAGLPSSTEVLLEGWDHKFKARSTRSCDCRHSKGQGAGTVRVRVGGRLDVTWSEFYPVNVTKAERIRRGEKVCKRLGLGKEGGESTWEVREIGKELARMDWRSWRD